LLDAVFPEMNYRRLITRQLQALFMPSDQKEQLVMTLIDVLTQLPAVVPKPSINIIDIAVDATHIIEPTSIQTFTIRTQKSERYLALLADVHANNSALNCVFDYLKAHNINQGIVLGDIVGYGPEPKECIERLQNANFQVIKGNHDHAAAVNNTDKGFSSNAKLMIDWTVEQLSLEQRAWLNNLPVTEKNEEWFAVHGAPMDPAFFYGYVYVMTYQDNLDYMQTHQMPLCFHGHSHMPGIFARNKGNQDVQLSDKKIALAPYPHALVCPGSVGQPRNGCTETQFAIYDREQREVTFLSLPYDVEPVVQKMRDYQLPEVLWRRLLDGK
jgi:predicted phosphodiesterase